MKNSRRKFLKIAGATAAGLGLSTTAIKALESTTAEPPRAPDPHAAPAVDTIKMGKPVIDETAPVADVKKNPPPSKAKQWAMVVDTRQFKSSKDLEPVVNACNKIHNIPSLNKKHEIKWIWEEEYKHLFPSLETKFLAEEVKHRPFPALCNHCENPPCVRACPTQATFKRKDGIVLMDFHRCIGCRFCMAACPYGARSFNYVDPRPNIEEFNPQFPTRTKGVVEKCNFCAERLAKGQWPACVEASNGAITFGDLDDPDSDVRKVLKNNFSVRRNVSLGTEPSVYYII
ncbi:MAG: 4Fe-4S dicluster domain-containing protein [Fibrobacteria bacterium]|nr:4Fe-4S dicluster domain-containing protein [Fibrobacteria bacterium]